MVFSTYLVKDISGQLQIGHKDTRDIYHISRTPDYFREPRMICKPTMYPSQPILRQTHLGWDRRTHRLAIIDFQGAPHVSQSSHLLELPNEILLNIVSLAAVQEPHVSAYDTEYDSPIEERWDTSPICDKHPNTRNISKVCYRLWQCSRIFTFRTIKVSLAAQTWSSYLYVRPFYRRLLEYPDLWRFCRSLVISVDLGIGAGGQTLQNPDISSMLRERLSNVKCLSFKGEVDSNVLAAITSQMPSLQHVSCEEPPDCWEGDMTVPRYQDFLKPIKQLKCLRVSGPGTSSLKQDSLLSEAHKQTIQRLELLSLGDHADTQTIYSHYKPTDVPHLRVWHIDYSHELFVDTDRFIEQFLGTHTQTLMLNLTKIFLFDFDETDEADLICFLTQAAQCRPEFKTLEIFHPFRGSYLSEGGAPVQDRDGKLRFWMEEHSGDQPDDFGLEGIELKNYQNPWKRFANVARAGEALGLIVKCSSSTLDEENFLRAKLDLVLMWDLGQGWDWNNSISSYLTGIPDAEDPWYYPFEKEDLDRLGWDYPIDAVKQSKVRLEDYVEAVREFPKEQENFSINSRFLL
ncbi:hypothetical protein BT63DRAFT_466489 [Microthyrium microscopicum]|uniref:Uncharacterized protein n=1 Tax=Microthyrium microscopicum TaxID=703497 RepID=A0A6A6UL72_9PEZI|nr:hypothetical protein BT63DRAFT_466489 [Microthyrium microscopicum]